MSQINARWGLKVHSLKTPAIERTPEPIGLAAEVKAFRK